jgi:hypothetical protein
MATMSPFLHIKPALGKFFTMEGGKVDNPGLYDSPKVGFNFYIDLVRSQFIDRDDTIFSLE